MNKLVISIIMYINDEKNLNESLASIISEKQLFLNNVQLILSGTLEIKRNVDYYLEKYSNIIYLEANSINEAYNKSIDLISGDYVNFTRSSNVYDKKFLRKVLKIINNKKSSLISLSPKYFLKGKETSYLHFKRKSENINLLKDYYKFNLCLNSYFIKKEILIDKYFDDKLNGEAEYKFLIEILNKEMNYYLIDNAYLYCKEPLERDVYSYSEQFYNYWYNDSIKNFIIPILKKYDYSLLTQIISFYLIQVKYACNMNDRNDNIISGNEVKEFFKLTGKALSYIDDSLITEEMVKKLKLLPKFMSMHFLQMKKNDFSFELKKVFRENTLDFYNDNVRVGTLEDKKIDIVAINYENGKLSIDGSLDINNYFANDKFKLYVDINGHKKELKNNKIYSLTKFFNVSFHKKYTFEISIDENLLNFDTKIKFYLSYLKKIYILKLNFCGINTKITNKFRFNYWTFSDKIIHYDRYKSCIITEKRTNVKVILHEIKLICSYLLKLSWKSRFRSFKAIILRLVYWLTKPYFRKKNIWITYDKLYKGGDNGEYLFKYVSNLQNKDNVRIYYIINKNSFDYKKLKKKYKYVLPFNSFKNKLIVLHSNMIFATHQNIRAFVGYSKKLSEYFINLMNFDVVCIQHGLTIQKIAQYQNILEDNTKLYFLASKYEFENVSKPIYGYDHMILKKTGLARYDGLINRDKKQILIVPTWRKNVVNASEKMGTTRKYNDNFKNTEYFKIYNNLINDKKLLKNVQEKGYKIVFLIHPTMGSQIQDYKSNNCVSIVNGANVDYEKYLTESSLMITDYSGIQFDFAYMRKPMIYYHPSSLPPHYEEGGLKYKEMGFGPICQSHDKLIEILCDYIDKKCIIEKIYKKRCDVFFYYSDYNNCQRIYNDSIKYLRENNNYKI